MENLCNDYPIVRMATVFNINRGGFYRWIKHPLTKREIEDIKLSKKVKNIFFEYKQRYGSPRISKEYRNKVLHVQRIGFAG